MLSKIGSYEVLSVHMAEGGSRGLRRALAKSGCPSGTERVFRKAAHRANFDHVVKKPGMLYVRSRAISSRCNDNFDEFPADEIKKAHATFMGKPVFVNHHNENHRRARGVIVAEALHEDTNPDGTPDTWVEVLMEVDAVNFPKLAKAILAGEIDRTSMGTDVAYSICSACGNKAATPLDYCAHIPRMKGQIHYRRTATGERGPGEVIREICYGLGFFENSLLVEEPADPTAHFLGVESGDMAVTASRKTAAVPSQLGTRYTCRNAHNSHGHDRGDGKPTRKKCSYCGAEFTSEEGYYFVLALTWEQGNIPMSKLPMDTVVSASRTEAQAKSWIEKSSGSFEGLELYEMWIESTDRRFPEAIASASSGRTSVKLAKTASMAEGCPECGHALQWGRHPGEAGRFGEELGFCPQCEWKGTEDDLQSQGSRRTASKANEGKTSSMTTTAYGEQQAPAEVDTMRDETCPVCGEKDSYDGDQCMVCEFIRPPDQFMDPDLTKAQQVDLRQTNDEKAGLNKGVQCDSCGATFGGGTPVTARRRTALDMPKPQTEEGATVEPQAGDTCPTCNAGTLQEISPAGDPAGDAALLPAFEPPEAAAPEQDAEGDKDEEDGADEPDGEDDPDGKSLTAGDDEDDEKGKKKPFPPKKKSQLNPELVHPHDEGTEVDMRPVLAAVLQQQHMALADRQAIQRIAELAGVDVSDIYATADRKIASIKRQADAANPAQPIPAPPAEAPVANTPEQTSGLNSDDVLAPGSTSETDVSPDATTSLETPGTVIDEPLNLNQQDVTKPVAGTEGPQPVADVRTETDVRVGTPSDTSPANPLQGPFAEKATLGNRRVDPRTIASMRLASLKIATNTAQGYTDQVTLATTIVTSAMTDDQIQHEIRTLDAVVKNAGLQAQAPIVAPAISAQAGRAAPSFAPVAPPVGGQLVGESSGQDTALFE